jgi:AcrR family transcriptional regulator
VTDRHLRLADRSTVARCCALLRRHGMSVDEIAAAVGATSQAVRVWVKGSALPKCAPAERLASLFEQVIGDVPGVAEDVAAIRAAAAAPVPVQRSSPRVDPLKVVDLYSSGYTFAEIAAEIGASVEGVRRVWAAATGLNALSRSARFELLYGAEIRAVTADAVDLHEVVAAFPGLSAVQVLRVASDCRPDLVFSKREMFDKVGYRQFSDDDLIAALRSVADGRVLSGVGYDTARAQSPRTLPSRALIVARFGTWSEAVAAAGLASNVARRARYRRRWSDEECAQIVHRFVEWGAENGVEPRYTAFVAWLSRCRVAGEDFPSAPLIRLRLGRWFEALQASRAVSAA